MPNELIFSKFKRLKKIILVNEIGGKHFQEKIERMIIIIMYIIIIDYNY